MPHDLNTELANAKHSWNLKAEQHKAAADKIIADGPRLTAGPVSRDVMHANLDEMLDRAAPHQLRAEQYESGPLPPTRAWYSIMGRTLKRPNSGRLTRASTVLPRPLAA